MTKLKIFTTFFIFNNLNFYLLLHTILLMTILAFSDFKTPTYGPLLFSILIILNIITLATFIISAYHQLRYRLIDRYKNKLYFTLLLTLCSYESLKLTNLIPDILGIELLLNFLCSLLSCGLFLHYILIAAKVQDFVILVKRDYELKEDIIKSFKIIDGNNNIKDIRGQHLYYPFQKLTLLKTHVLLDGKEFSYEHLTFIEQELEKSCILLNSDEQLLAQMLLV